MKFKQIDSAVVEQCAARFMSKVLKAGADECWPWQGAVKGNGYGYFRLTAEAGMVNAHKFAWLLANGETGNNYVCHRCDNRLCCNPAHLWLGSAKDNQMDMASKGRVKSYAKANPSVPRGKDGKFKEH